mmetsp:Transcript_28699/g.27689  ORF Transcript_28699/g.27689 Transcript_28699/m.27689 type:complete len:199 (-) Transcript_28699:8-604(-)
MFGATACQEGYYCRWRTTTNDMLNNKCGIGYYCPRYASSLADFRLCEGGYYCPEGSASSNFKQNGCLPGYFCPNGTAGTLSLDGTYSEIYQLSKEDLIEAIHADQDFQAEVIKPENLARIQEELADAERNNDSVRVSQLEWEVQMYSFNVSRHQEAELYLLQLAVENRCAEDDFLPRSLINQYYQNGQNLKCPNGTTS